MKKYFDNKKDAINAARERNKFKSVVINDDSCDLDLTEAENLLQIITFGEAIYG